MSHRFAYEKYIFGDIPCRFRYIDYRTEMSHKCQFKVALEDSKPPIWRRFFVDSTITFFQFHKSFFA
jgi:hypothetical protein